MTDTTNILGTEQEALTVPTSDEKTMAVLSHILCLVVGFIPPLVIYLVKKDSPYMQAHAKESLNFQLTLFLAWIGIWVLTMILSFVISFFSLILMPFLMVILVIAAIVLIIVATIKASENKLYRYPFAIRFIK